MRRIGLMMLALVLCAGIMAGCAEQKKKAEKVEKEAPAQTEAAEAEKPAETMKEAPMAQAPAIAEDGQKAPEAASKMEGEAAMAVDKAEKKVAEATATMEKAAGEKMEEAAAMAGAVKEPVADAKSIDAGAAIYATKCSPCHGASGKGTPMAPSFVGNAWVKDSSHAQVADVIKNGRSGAAKRYKEFVIAMPANKLPDSDVSALVDYLKSIN